MTQMTLPRVWVYNYDFEFELAAERSVVDNGTGFLPWYFLNRSWHATLPLASGDDTIMVYETPSPDLLENIGISRLPRFCVIDIAQESNSVFDDLVSFTDTQSHAEYRLSPWGWSPKAFQFAETAGLRKGTTATAETVHRWNAKTISHRLRQSHLSPLVPGAIVQATDVGTDGLEPVIAEFVRRNGPSWIKHSFGTAGRLSDRQADTKISARKLRKWESWLRKSGEILLEQHVLIRQEWSLQVEFKPGGQVLPIGLTRLYSGPGGNYSGTLLSERDQLQVPILMEKLAPIMNEISGSGYTGPAGFDLIECEDDSFRLLEINARLTMGRVAYEWHRMVSDYHVSFFTNLFLTVKDSQCERSLLEKISRIVPAADVRMTILNLVLAPAGKKAMLSLLVQGNDVESTLSGIAAVKSETRRL